MAVLDTVGATLAGMRDSNINIVDNLAAANERAVNYLHSGDYRRASVLFEKTLHGCQNSSAQST